jgi:hypothetical protein
MSRGRSPMTSRLIKLASSTRTRCGRRGAPLPAAVWPRKPPPRLETSSGRLSDLIPHAPYGRRPSRTPFRRGPAVSNRVGLISGAGSKWCELAQRSAVQRGNAVGTKRSPSESTGVKIRRTGVG